MKTKLTHLIIASLISLSVVLSTTGISYAGSFVTKRSTYRTTAASGFDEGPITQKNDNGGSHFEVYVPNYGAQPPLDLRLDMLRVNHEKVRVTVRNISSRKIINGLLWIQFSLINPDNPGEKTGWSQAFDVPDPYQNMTTYIVIHPKDIVLQPNDGIKWRLHAWANYVGFEWQLDESNYSNNHKVICRYDEDCP